MPRSLYITVQVLYLKRPGFWNFLQSMEVPMQVLERYTKMQNKKPSEILWIPNVSPIFSKESFGFFMSIFKLCDPYAPHLHQQPTRHLGALNLRSLAGSHICQQLIPRHLRFDVRSAWEKSWATGPSKNNRQDGSRSLRPRTPFLEATLLRALHAPQAASKEKGEPRRTPRRSSG